MKKIKALLLCGISAMCGFSARAQWNTPFNPPTVVGSNSATYWTNPVNGSLSVNQHQVTFVFAGTWTNTNTCQHYIQLSLDGANYVNYFSYSNSLSPLGTNAVTLPASNVTIYVRDFVLSTNNSGASNSTSATPNY